MNNVAKLTKVVSVQLIKTSSLLRCSRMGITYSETRHRRCYSMADTIPPVDAKEFPPKITKIVDEISNLTLIEVADLNELLKKTLNISDTPMMAMGAMPGAAPKEEEEEEVKVEKSTFTVKLTAFNEKKKIALIKEMKLQVPEMNLVQAKKFVESIPQVVRADIAKEEAESLQKALEAAGATVELS